MTRILAVVTLLALTPRVEAIGPSVSALFPAGAQRGTTVQFTVVGLYLHNGCEFEMISSSGCVEACDRIEVTETVHFEKVVIPYGYFGAPGIPG